MLDRGNGKKPESEKGGALTLNFHQQPPEFPFLNVFFDLTIYLQELGTGEPKCGADLPIDLNLYYDAMPRVIVPAKCVEVEEPDKLFIRSDTGCCKARVRITLCSMDLENKSFLICATAPEKKSAIVDAFSTPFKVMRYRLVVKDDPAWEDPWYKDEGGREKCIELKVKLVDYESRLVKSRQVPLKVSLLYADSLLPVTDQTILKVFGPAGFANNTFAAGQDQSEPIVVVEQGVATVKVRIDDVSKNHQNQNFRVKIAPDTLRSPTDCDVSHDTSKPVAVKSKRNKKRSKKAFNEVGSSSNSGNASAAIPPKERNFIDFATRQHGVGAGGGFPSFPPAPPPAPHRNSAASFLDEVGAVGGSRQALQCALGWCAHAVETLQRQVMWKHQGFATNFEGIEDRNQPLYTITNPNSLIEELVQSYERGVKPYADALDSGQWDEDDGMAPSTKRQRLELDDDLKRNGHSSSDFINATQEVDDDDDEEDMIAGGEVPRLRPPEFSGRRNSINAVVDALRGSTGAHVSGDESRVNERGDDEDFGDEAAMPATSRSLSSLARPSMNRGVSSLITGGDAIPFERTKGLSRPVDLTEKAVRIVLAKRLKLPRSKTPLGFPAFDSEDRLVGLFQDIEDGQQHTQIVFVSADSPELGLTELDCDHATAALHREIEDGSDCVKDIRVHGSFEKLKEAVAIYHWSKEAFTNDIDLRNPSREIPRGDASSGPAPASFTKGS